MKKQICPKCEKELIRKYEFDMWCLWCPSCEDVIAGWYYGSDPKKVKKKKRVICENPIFEAAPPNEPCTVMKWKLERESKFSGVQEYSLWYEKVPLKRRCTS